MANKRLVILTGILLLGAVFRFHLLGRDLRFHPDEALFVTFARQAAVHGDWLLLGSLDKPPLTIYVNALSLSAFGVTTLSNGVLTLDVHRGEFAARIPGVWASILVVAVLYPLSKRLYQADYRTATIATLVMALSPLAIAFSATAFTDGLMLLLLVLSAWMASRRRWLPSGIFLAASIWSKQQAILYLPLVLAIGWLSERQFKKSNIRPRLLPFILAIVAGFVALLAWDAARGQSTSLWALASANNDSGRIARLDEWIPRLTEWWAYGRYLISSPVATVVLVGFAIVGFVLGCNTLPAKPFTSLSQTKLLLGYAAFYMLVHWLTAVNIYDRYLLLLLPPASILLGRGITKLLRQKMLQKLSLGLVLSFALVIGMGLLEAWRASEAQLPIGGDRGRHQGIEQLTDYLNMQRLGAIVYDHWLGWELGYYMGAWSDKRRVYYPDPKALTADALVQPDRAPRYFVVPDWADAGVWLTALQNAGFKPAETFHYTRFKVYELTPP